MTTSRGMGTELSDPYFCPPRLVRQGQGRASQCCANATTTTGGLRFAPSARKQLGKSQPGKFPVERLKWERPAADDRDTATSEYDNLHTPTDDDSDCSFRTVIDLQKLGRLPTPGGAGSRSPTDKVQKQCKEQLSNDDTTKNVHTSAFACEDTFLSPLDTSSNSNLFIPFTHNEPMKSKNTPSPSSVSSAEEPGYPPLQQDSLSKNFFRARVIPCDSEREEQQNGNSVAEEEDSVEAEVVEELSWFGSRDPFVILHPEPVPDLNETPDERTSRVQQEFQKPDYQKLMEDLLGDPVSARFPFPPQTTPDLDSDTLRKAAAKNREVSRKLFKQYSRQQRSPKHERQSSGLSSGSLGTESLCSGSPKNERTIAKSPSQLSSGASSIYADSSGSSGIGTLPSTVHKIPTSTKDFHSEHLIRSLSSENFLSPGDDDEAITGIGSVNLAMWNTPQQRRNIFSLVDETDTDFVALAATEAHQSSNGRSGVLGSRGVSRKISNRRKATAKEARALQSLPDLSQDTDNPPGFPLQKHLHNGVVPDSGFVRSTSRESGAKLASHHRRSSSPVYAVPWKTRAERSTPDMKSPPPLPRKPPPPLDVFQPQSSPSKYNSSPCLAFEARCSCVGMSDSPPVPPRRPSREAPARPPICPRSVHSRTPALFSAAGKPTVQVHPMCVSGSSESPDHLFQLKKPLVAHLSSDGGRTSPRPPVPKKPQFLAGAKQSAPSPVQVESDELPESASKIPSPSPYRQKQLYSVEDRCNRLSAFVCQNDERLRGVFQRQTVDPAEGLQNGCEDDKQQSESETRAKFLVDIYSRPRLPVWQSQSRDSVDGADHDELDKKKFELVASLSRKLKILEEEEKSIEEEMLGNERLGESVLRFVEESGSALAEKLAQFMADSGTITCLLLKLAAQIQRVHAALQQLPEDDSSAEKKLFLHRRDRLLTQEEEAKGLREALDDRGERLLAELKELLNEEQMADYQYFIRMKSKLLVDATEIQDKMALGQEQKAALELSLPAPPSALVS